MNIFDTISRVTTPWQESAARFRSPVLLVTAETERGAIVSAENAAEAVAINPLIRVARELAGDQLTIEVCDLPNYPTSAGKTSTPSWLPCVLFWPSYTNKAGRRFY